MKNKSQHAYKESPEYIGNMDDEPNVLYGDSLNIKIGKEIKKLRLENDFSQEQFGELIGTKKANVSMLENGKLNPSILYLEKVANALNLDLLFSFKER